MVALKTVSEVITALDGPTKAAALFKKPPRTPQAVTNWRSYGHLPSSTYVLLTRELKKRGYSAPPSLFAMDE